MSAPGSSYLPGEDTSASAPRGAKTVRGFFIIYRHIWHKRESSEFTSVAINICLDVKKFGG